MADFRRRGVSLTVRCYFCLHPFFLPPSPTEGGCKIYRSVTTEIYESEFGYLDVFRPYVFPLNDPDFEDRFSWVSQVGRRTNEKEI